MHFWNFKSLSLPFGFSIFLLILRIEITNMQIIGSSVVTSVSVVLGSEDVTTVPSVSKQLPSAISLPKESTEKPTIGNKVVMVLKNTTDPGILSVIATLKSIVEEEHQKQTNTSRVTSKTKTHDTTNVTTQSIQSSDERLPTVVDDEEDDKVIDSSTVSVKAPPTEFPVTMVVKSFENIPEVEAENDTATSAEVHEAIHRISGALLKPGKKTTKPIENILTDVLTSINDERNVTAVISSTALPVLNPENLTITPVAITMLPTKLTTNVPSSSNQSQLRTKGGVTVTLNNSTENLNATTEPEIGPTVVGNKGNGKISLSQSQDESSERETEEDISLAHGATPKPTTRKPMKKVQIHYFTKPGKKNVSSTQYRPTDFYDDEIFGYDPYQTFHHGVYVAQNIEDEETSSRSPPSNDVPHHYHVTNMRPQPRPVHPNTRTTLNSQASGQSSSGLMAKVRKPMPSLPDHLHRPRPSHLQYQHSAVDAIDTETGLTVVKVLHPGEKFSNQKENLEADKLVIMTPRPSLPHNIVSNLASQQHETQQNQIEVSTTTMNPQGSSLTFLSTPDLAVSNLQPQVNTRIHVHPNRHSTKSPVVSHRTPTQAPLFVQHLNKDHLQKDGSHGHQIVHNHVIKHDQLELTEKRPIFPKAPTGNPGLEGTVTSLDPEMKAFVNINNRLAIRFFNSVTKDSQSRNVVMSPFTVISSLGILFLGARGSTAAQFDALLNFDDQLTFNPHLMYHNISQSFLSQSNTAAAIIRLLIADKNKGDVLEFFKMRVQHFYDARVEEVDYKYAGHLAQSIINQMIRAQIQRHSYEMVNRSLPLTGPLSLLTAAFFDGQFGGIKESTVQEMDFIYLADLGRQLVPIPAIGLRGAFRGVYDEILDATAVEIPYSTRDLSLLLLLPGKAEEFPIGGMNALKHRLTMESWTGLMRGFYMRDPFKIIIPRFRHHSALNLTKVTQRFGLTDMFGSHLAKFKGINGLTDLYLDSNVMHFAELSTWGKLSDTLNEAVDGDKKKLDLVRILRPHVRGEPLSINDWVFMSRTPVNTPLPRTTNQIPGTGPLPPLSYTRIRSSRSKAQERQGVREPLEETILRFERPFLYVLRHNPTGMILMMGQYNEPTTMNQS